MPETRTVKGFSEVLLPLVEGDFESVPLRPLRYISVFTVEYNNNTKSGGGQAKFAAKRPSPKESIDTNRPA